MKDDETKSVKQKRCYAAFLGGCHGDMTKEHPYSKNVLKIAESAIWVSGYRWQGKQKEAVKKIYPSDLVYSVLCKGHNCELSPVDKAGGVFYKRLVLSTQRLIDPTQEGSQDTNVLSGALIERWFLKAVCGLWAGREYTDAPGWENNSQPKPEWVEVVFGKRELPRPLGLYVGRNPEGRFETSRLTINQIDHLGQDYVLGSVFQCNGLVFILNLTSDPKESEAFLPSDAEYRPSSLWLFTKALTGEDRFHIMEFDWGEQSGSKLATRILRADVVTDGYRE